MEQSFGNIIHSALQKNKGTFPRLLIALASVATLQELVGLWDKTNATEVSQELSAEDIEYEKAERFYQQHEKKTIVKTNIAERKIASQSAEKEPSRFSGTLAYQAFSQYNAYGIVIQDQGVSSQPFLNLRYRVYDNKDTSAFVNSATVFLTTWSDFSSNTNLSNPTSPYKNFTETDLIVGFNTVFAQRFSATFNWTTYVSPAGAYGWGSWLRGTLLYDDSRQISPSFSLKPQFSVVYTIPAASSISLIPSAFLFEPGLTPNFNLWGGTHYVANLSFPIRVGLGYKYYADSTYGFASVGSQFMMRLPQLSGKTFTTNLGIGYLYYNLGPSAANFAANKSSNQNVFNIGLYVNF